VVTRSDTTVTFRRHNCHHLVALLSHLGGTIVPNPWHNNDTIVAQLCQAIGTRFSIWGDREGHNSLYKKRARLSEWSPAL